MSARPHGGSRVRLTGMLLLIAGASLLLLSAFWLAWTARLLDGGVTVRGEVSFASGSTVWVEVAGARPGDLRYLPVRRSWWFVARRGTPVVIVHDPQANYDRFLFPSRARIRSWPALWAGPLALAVAGCLLCGLYALMLISAGRIRARVEIRREGGAP